MWDRLSPCASILLLVWLAAGGNTASQPAPCDKSRKVFTESWGIVTDGPVGANYTQDSHCEWLIKANNSRQFITLSFRSMGTECSYDYVFVYDGSSFTSPLLGSFSGKTEPQQVTATSGSMLILLYSDTNYVLDGFRAEFSVTECPRNCSEHGLCVNHACACDADWGGRDCAIRLCPEDCGVAQGRGVCKNGQCVCNKGYSGQACSLSRADTAGRSWHHLSHSENGFSPRAAHSVVYINETDSLYVFGGFDLNHVLGDLVIYRFATSRWEDEDGKQLDGTAVWSAPLDPPALAAVLEKGDQRWGLPPKSSLFHAVLRSVKDNATLSVHRQRLDPRGEHLARIPREAGADVDDLEGITTLEPEAPAAQQTEMGGEEGVTTEQTQVPSTSPSPPPSTTSHIPHLPSRPAPRYGHAACRSAAGMVMYGGKLSDGSLSGELWLYDLKLRRWSLRAVNSKIRPPRLTRHTITLADGYLYLFGGSTPGGDFSSQLFRIRIIPGEKGAEEEEWEEVRPRGGKELDVRVVAHSTVFHAYSNCLIVYGGVVAGVKRYSKLSDRMFAFQLDSRHWAELSYPRAHLPDTYVPRERAFHTSSIIGNYLVVFGGYSHRHNKEEICYDSQLYLYHLGCHTWVNHEVFGTAEKVSRYPKQQGVFAHAAAVRNGNTLLIVGGYHGNVNADLLAFVLPPTLVSREGESYEPEQSCVKYGKTLLTSYLVFSS